MIKQISDLSEATIDDLNDNCQFVMDDSNDKTKKVSFNVLKQKIGTGYGSGQTMPAVVGSIIPYMGTDLPEGYLMCDGSEVDKITYSELYAVIGDRFGTASDTSKFKLPKLNDNIYLQGSNDPCLCVDEELPNITGKIDASGQPNTSESFGEIYADRTITEGAFKDGLIIGNQGATLEGGDNEMMRGFKFDASKSSSIYKDNGHVIPNSVTVRYLICYKKVIGKVDAMIGMPDYKATPVDVKAAIDASTDKKWIATENGWLHCLYDDSHVDPTNQFYVYIKTQYNKICIYKACREVDGDNDAQLTIIPISTGDAVIYERDSLNRGSINFYPCKAVPQKSDKEEILKLIYPIGSIYTTISSLDKCPFEGIDGMHWEKIASGKCLFGADETHNVGSEISAGLPNITGTFNARTGNWGDETGAFYFISDKLDGANNAYSGSIKGFDASRSNPIYGNSNTVQPPAIAVIFWQRVS